MTGLDDFGNLPSYAILGNHFPVPRVLKHHLVSCPMSNHHQSMQAQDDADAIFNTMAHFTVEMDWAIHTLEKGLDLDHTLQVEGRDLLLALQLLRDFALNGTRCCALARGALLMEYMRKPRTRAEGAAALRPKVAESQQALREASAIYMAFLEKLPGADIDHIKGNRPPRKPPPYPTDL